MALIGSHSGSHGRTVPASGIGVTAIHLCRLIEAVHKLECHGGLTTRYFIVMVEINNLYLVVSSADVYSLCISHLEEFFRHTQATTNLNIFPIGIVQGSSDLEGIDIDDTNDFQSPSPSFLRAAKDVLNTPIAQLGRVENRFTIGHLSG